MKIAESNAGKIFGHLESLSLAVTSLAVEYENASFPNVTIPHFDVRSQQLVEKTGAELVLWVPIVEASKREGWIEFMRNEIASSHEYVSLCRASSLL